MLRKPGTSAGKGSKPTRTRKTVTEKPEELVRKIQRIPTNKKCADCTSKLPQVVNLTFGTFICMACAGVHREFSHRVKGIGHSSFTADEVKKLQSSTSGNEAVNAIYMARYDPSSIRERLRPPTDNNDLQLLRVWIRRKYIDKAWFRDDDNVLEKKEKKDAKVLGEKEEPKKKGKTKSKLLQPTVAALPPKVTTAPVVDLFGGWDANPDEKKQTNDPFKADFSAQSTTFNNEPFVADFNKQPTTANSDQNSFAADFSNMEQPKNEPSFQANFDQINSSSNVVTTGQQQLSSFPTNFGNFDQPFESDKKTGDVGSNTKAQSSVPDKTTFAPSFDNFPSNSFPPANEFQQKSTSSVDKIEEENQKTMAKRKSVDPFDAFASLSVSKKENISSDASIEKDPLSQSVEMKNDPFDAFANLSGKKNDENRGVNMNGASNGNINLKEKAAEKSETKYTEGQLVFYKEVNGSTTEVTVLKVHLDDELIPFYTIKFASGREKQTDDVHLTLNNVGSGEGSSHSKISTQENVIINGFHQDASNKAKKADVDMMTQPIGQNQMLQMIENFTFPQLLMMQQVITMKMQQIQMQQHAQMMAISQGLHANPGMPSNSLGAVSAPSNTNPPPNPPSEAPPPPP